MCRRASKTVTMAKSSIACVKPPLALLEGSWNVGGYRNAVSGDHYPRPDTGQSDRSAGAARRSGAARRPFVRVEFLGDTRLLEDYVALRHPNSSKGWLAFLPAVPYAKSIEVMLTADALFFIETSDLSNLSARGVLTTKLLNIWLRPADHCRDRRCDTGRELYSAGLA